MPEVTIGVGGRDYVVACREGEEHFLASAARMLDVEAQTLFGQIGRMPETRTLLMAGLMLADKTAGLEDQLRTAQERLALQETQMAALRKLPEPARVEVPVLSAQMAGVLASVAERAEAMADEVEARLRA